MEDPKLYINSEDETVIALKELYRRYGYKPYKMSKFEPYDLYVENKNFLISDHVISFSDLGGKLMALRPDVTLSIIKSVKASEETEKLFYRENVYRTLKGSKEIREILQMGLECIGDIGVYETCEVLLLAAKSLESIAGSYVIDISHMGFLSGLLSASGADASVSFEIISCIKEKNTHDISKICRNSGISDENAGRLCEAASLWGTFEEVLPKLRAISVNADTDAALEELENVYALLKTAGCSEHFRIDFSVVHDIDYYDRIVFSGFIEGIPVNVLTGGRYDKLLKRFDSRSGAIGFAVYLGILTQYAKKDSGCDADIVLFYDGDTDMKALMEAVRDFTENDRAVAVYKKGSGHIGQEQYYVHGKELERI